MSSTLALWNHDGGIVPGVYKDVAGAPATSDRDASSSFVTRSGAMSVKRIAVESRTADFIASTDDIDAHGDVIEQESWILDHFLANPICLFGHQSYELPIGQAIYCAVSNGQLECTIKFASAEANPRAEEVWRLVQEKVLRAVSVGFVPTDGRYEMREGREVFVWRSPILKEISVVPVPANHAALARAKAAIVARHTQAEPPARPGPQPENAAEEHSMDVKELEAKVKELEAKSALAEAKCGEASTKAATSDAKVLALETNVRDCEAKIKTLETDKAALDAAVKAAETSLKTLESDHAKACAERDALTEKTIEQEVDALVGKKLLPTDKAEFVDLRKSNPALFARMIAKRPDLSLTENIVDTKSNAANGTIPDAAERLRKL